MMKRFWGSHSGNVAIAAAIAVFPIMLAVGAVVDLTNMARIKSDLQSALDAASMQIAVNLNSGRDAAALQSLGEAYLRAHIDPDLLAGDQGGPTLTYYGLTTEENGTQSILTRADHVYKPHFPAWLGFGGNTNLALHAKVSSRVGDSACVYALSRTAPRAVEAAGSTSVIMDGCVIASNSTAADSVYVGGSATLAADCIQSSGGIVATAALSVDCATNRENAWPVPDPLASLQEPVPPVLLPDPKNDPIVQPGRYSNLTLSGTKTLQPGLYYIEGSLSIKGEITGTGVTFFLKDGGVTVNGSASLTLSAPQEGDYAGILFFAAPNNTSSHTFNGNGATELNGFLYFPAGALDYLGNNGTTSTCLRIAAATVKMSGSSTLKSDCTAELGGREARVSGPLYFAR